MTRTVKFLPWIALVTVWILWGSTYLGIRMAVETMPPLLMAGVRYLLAGGLMYVMFAPRHARGPQRPTRRHLGASLIAGAFLFVGGNGLLTVAEKHIPSGLAALIVATVPVWMVVINAAMSRTRVAAPVLIGLALGLAGVYLLVGGPGSTLHVGYALLILFASVMWAVGSVYARTAPLPPHPLVSAATQMIAGGLLLVLLGAATGEFGAVNFAAISVRSIVGFAWLLVPGSIIAFTAYVYALRTLPADQVATYAYVNPVVAVLLGALVDHEPVTVNIAISGAVIVVAVALIIRSKGSGKRPTAKPPSPADSTADATLTR